MYPSISPLQAESRHAYAWAKSRVCHQTRVKKGIVERTYTPRNIRVKAVRARTSIKSVLIPVPLAIFPLRCPPRQTPGRTHLPTQTKQAPSTSPSPSPPAHFPAHAQPTRQTYTPDIHHTPPTVPCPKPPHPHPQSPAPPNTTRLLPFQSPACHLRAGGRQTRGIAIKTCAMPVQKG